MKPEELEELAEEELDGGAVLAAELEAGTGSDASEELAAEELVGGAALDVELPAEGIWAAGAVDELLAAIPPPTL